MFRPVVYFATNHDWRGYQHFYQGLAKAFSETRPLLYVGGVTTGSGRFDHVAENIWLLNARVPNGTGRASLRPIRDQILARATRRATTKLGWNHEAPLVFTYTSDAAAFIRRAPGASSAYWTGDEVVDRYESGLLDCVQQVFTVSPAATSRVRRLVEPSRVTEMPIATDPGPYVEAAKAKQVPADLSHLPRPWFGYGGAVNVRTDWALMRSLAAATTGTVVVVGPAIDDEGRRQVESADRPKNLVFLGHRDADAAPHYIAAFDVGLIPYSLSEFNVGSNPVKTYDYLAAGLPVVATDLPAIRPLVPHVTIAANRDDFVRLALDASKQVGGQQDRQSVASMYSYDVLVARIDEVLGSATRLP